MKSGLLLLLLSACGSDGGSGSSQTDPESTDTDVAQGNTCSPRDTPITRIADVIALINELPKPLSLDCLIASLRHPLEVQATASRISAQPAISREQPRIFLQSEGLFLSVVPGDNLLEFGETWQETLSIKGELAFPIEEALSDNAPFVQIGPIFNQTQTRCGGPCHTPTVEHSKMGGVSVFASQIVRPNPEFRVPLEELKAAWNNCTTLDEAACQLYKAMFDAAEPVSFEFNEDLPFF
ncbi:hypothetical protein [Oligoflexus tunisiensis]|uniref:hypothetical protein n=1 Tax=Oligoflexus tunisiensis TaxID=708132 RepID=UPI001C402715|nr:hypothetical protein [Oligoflexus tunisiensis]